MFYFSIDQGLTSHSHTTM